MLFDFAPSWSPAGGVRGRPRSTPETPDSPRLAAHSAVARVPYQERVGRRLGVGGAARPEGYPRILDDASPDRVSAPFRPFSQSADLRPPRVNEVCAKRRP